MAFVHLHNHSFYSLLQSPSSPETIVKAAKKMDSTAVALTDNGVMYGTIEFYKACKEAGIKAIIGMEVNIAPRTIDKKEGKEDIARNTLVLLAETQEGYENLLKLSTIAHIDGMYYKPRVDKELLKKHKKGIIALSGGRRGEIPKGILESEPDDKIKRLIKSYIDIFGEDNFFLEIAHHPNQPEQVELNDKLIEFGKELEIPLVVTQNSYYIDSDESEAQDVLSCISQNRLVDDTNRPTLIGEDYSFQDPKVLKSEFKNEKEALENTVKIADRCNVTFELGSYHIPEFGVPKDHPTKNPMDMLRHECIEGLKKRYPQFEEYLKETKWKDLSKTTIVEEKEEKKKEEKKEEEKVEEKDKSDKEEDTVSDPSFSGLNIAKRFEHEFDTIKQMGFESYFLIVWDYIKWAKEQGILVGPGRGSGAGSIIAYALEITNLDPLSFSLLFERFLNPDRVSMPDFDIDFQDDRRGEVIEYVTNKYGADHVAQISTFGTMAARAAIKDVGRVFGIPFEKMNNFVKLIPERPGTKLKEAWDSEEDLRKAVEKDEELTKVWAIASKLEGCVRHISVHACAVVISEKPLNTYTALQHPPKDDKTTITQLSAKPLEALGLLKMDFLGLKNLTILDTACKIIKRTTGRNIVLDEIPMEDEKTYEIFQEGETTGIFQFESAGMKRYLKELIPTEFEHLIAMNSLYRPGPMDFIPDFIGRKHGKVNVEFPHECLEEILKPTYGIAVYQEQILQIAQAFSGYTLAQADLLRRAIGKKIAEEMDKQRETFINKAVELGRKKMVAEYIFDKVVVPFAGYGFNKSHSAAYSMIAYQTAFLKAHYPTEFMAALLTADQSNTDRIAIEIEECRRMGIEVLPPSVNESRIDFTAVKNRQIRFGLSAIKNLGNSCAEAIIDSRGEDNIKFETFEAFLTRIDVTQINRKNVEALIKSGALDNLGERNIMLFNSDKIIEYAQESHQKESSGQVGLFDSVDEKTVTKLELDKTEPAAFSQKLAWEKEFLGLFVHAHPLAGLEKYWDTKYFMVKNIEAKNVGSSKKFAGIVTNPRYIKTKKDEKMATFVLDAPTGKIEVAVFPKTFATEGKKVVEDQFVVVKGKIDHRNSDLQIIAETITRADLENVREEAKKSGLLDEKKNHLEHKKKQTITKDDVKDAKREPWVLEIPENTGKDDLALMKKLFEQNPGKHEVIMLFPNKQRLTIPQKINLTKTLKGHITQILFGPEKKR